MYYITVHECCYRIVHYCCAVLLHGMHIPFTVPGGIIYVFPVDDGEFYTSTSLYPNCFWPIRCTLPGLRDAMSYDTISLPDAMDIAG